MPLQNRVTPFGEIVAEPWRGRLMGNRGCLHDGERRLGRARWRSRLWIACRLEFRGRWRAPMPEGRYTALFFPDEAAAMAAGHRPCAECRRADYLRFKRAWAAAGLPGETAAEIDAVLHAARLDGRSQRREPMALALLPEGSMLTLAEAPGQPLLLWQGALHPLTGADYGPARPLPGPQTGVTALTPAPLRAVLAAGYLPETGL